MVSLQWSKRCSYSLLVICVTLVLAGCNSRQAAQAPQAVEVKVMQVIQKDTPITYEYVGQVKAKQEVQIQSKVAGNIIAKMVTGGAVVTAGQPLFQIDRRQYQAALRNAQAQLAQAEAVLGNSHADTLRYRQLADQNAIAQQTLDTQVSTERQNAAAVEAYQANVQQAMADMEDTLIVAPFSGRININDLSIGGYVAAGSTTLATISSVDPIFVQFSMSENEYLQMAQLGRGTTPYEWGSSVKLLLSNGQQYPLAGHIEQVDNSLTTDTGTLTLKALFDNPQKLLIPGMFARVVAEGQIHRGALLIPQRAVQQLLDKNVVVVAGEGDKAELRSVKMGSQVGNMWIVEEGLTVTDRVVVEGGTKVQAGTLLKVVTINADELQTADKQ